MLTLRRSRIRPVPPKDRVCYVCKEISGAVADDVAVGGFFGDGGINDALRAEMVIMATWRGMKVRHPKPDEFNDWDDH